MSSGSADRRNGRVVGVVPAAGYGARLGTLTGSKELLEVGGKPVMDHLVERLRVAGCDDIRVVTRPEKADLIAHAEATGLTLVLARPPSVSRSILAGLSGTEADDFVLLGFPDSVWYPVDGFVRLLDALDGFEVALGLFRGREPERSDVVQVNPAGLVVSVDVKPSAPSSEWIWGCAVARRGALSALADDPEPGVVFDSMSRSGAVVGVRLPGTFVDVGTPAALRAAGAADS